ncbi:MAG: nitroreductase family protein [Spirochaetia bacterium]|jgi:nitroreductase|uniref:Nitroreductase domain-containing protein n=1 Tax=bioreactor metagenome TaxID=1076179 RepID=A0A644TC22_9ZZZZ|nr:nitroreductase family protein [Spirochaetia bacterium]MDD3820726.1 nitroreductase family protein [Spirochaetales bacterium]NLX45984.1 nitroreductase [Treponema sp.]VBB38461.1 Nitroreductase [uncultured Spirochaetota bacterium]MCE1209159.1 nitroreductase family protein [Spirochaetia bacterium]
MDLLPELLGRRARRALSNEALDRAVVSRLLKAATLAPSCFNNQPWRILAVERSQEGPEYRSLAESLTTANAWALEAPLLLVFATAAHLDCRLDSGRDYAYFDLGQAAMALQLQAQREGLYAHPMAGFSPSKLKSALKIPPELVPLCLIAVGKPGDPEKLAEGPRKSEFSPRSRKALGEVAFSGDFSTPWA